MPNLPQPLSDSPSALVRVGWYLLVPVAGLLLLPILLLFLIALYLLAIFHGTRLVVISFTGQRYEVEEELQKPHFLDMQSAPQALADESPLPPKG